MKRILVLTGSPRIGGNSDMLAESFIKGALSAGHEVVRWDSGRKNIRPCKACDACFTKDTACSFSDDFNDLAKHYAQSDTLVLVTPLYWYSFPAQIKTALDKLYAFVKAEKPLGIKNAALIVCAEDDDPHTFDGIQRSFELICGYIGWNDLGHLFVPNVDKKGEVAETNCLKQAEAFGSRI